MAEAPAGCGKSLAYLVPTALAAQVDQKLIISTHSRTLQSQLISDWRNSIAPSGEFEKKVAVVKGRKNYVCARAISQESELDALDRKLASDLSSWIAHTVTGDISEFNHSITLPDRLTAACRSCDASLCSFYDRCYYYQAHRECESASIIIVNHALIFSHLWLKNTSANIEGLLPEYFTVVFDEAHHLPESAMDAFQSTYSTEEGRKFVDESLSTVRKYVLPDVISFCRSAVQRLNTEIEALTQPTQAEVPVYGDQSHGLIERSALALKSVQSVIETLVSTVNGTSTDKRIASECSGAALGLRRSIASAFFRFDSEAPNYFTIRTHLHVAADVASFSVTCRPISVQDTLHNLIWKNSPAKKHILISATLASQGSFTEIATALGISSGIRSEYLGEPVYDYKNQTLLYVPMRSYQPSQNDAYRHELSESVIELIEASGGGALILCTSHQSLNDLFARASDANLIFPIARQGNDTTDNLLTWFRTVTNPVLFGTFTFWEGIDLPGAQLRLVVIDKIPFPVPTRSNALASESRDKTQLTEYNLGLRSAETRLRQALGRLLRTDQDYGVAAILDSRLMTRPYGDILLRALPPMPITHETEAVRDFFTLRPERDNT